METEDPHYFSPWLPMAWISWSGRKGSAFQIFALLLCCIFYPIDLVSADIVRTQNIGIWQKKPGTLLDKGSGTESFLPEYRRGYATWLFESGEKFTIHPDGRLFVSRSKRAANGLNRPLLAFELETLRQAYDEIASLLKDPVKSLMERAFKMNKRVTDIFGKDPARLPHMDTMNNISLYLSNNSFYRIKPNGEIFREISGHFKLVPPERDLDRSSSMAELIPLMDSVVHSKKRPNLILKRYPQLAKTWITVKEKREYMRRIGIGKIKDLPRLNGDTIFIGPSTLLPRVEIHTETGVVTFFNPERSAKPPSDGQLRKLKRIMDIAFEFNEGLRVPWRQALRNRDRVIQAGFADPIYLPVFDPQHGRIDVLFKNGKRFTAQRGGLVLFRDGQGITREADRGEITVVGRKVWKAGVLDQKIRKFWDEYIERPQKASPKGLGRVMKIQRIQKQKIPQFASGNTKSLPIILPPAK